MTPKPPEHWSPVSKTTFRFIAVYSAMYMFYTWLRFQTIPGLTQLHRFLWPAWRNVVTFFNDILFHVRPTLVEPNGSTDTSFSWASLYTMLLLSMIITIAWTIIDRKRTTYQKEEYWLRIATRYCLAYFALYYGIIKLFAVQMPSPSLSQLSTQLGDLSATRLAWMFIGASTAYQVFSGVIETAAGLFLMHRRTVTLGAILSIAVFGNVVALNFSYDIPVKLMSAHLLLQGVYLLQFESRRVLDFFLNKPTTSSELYNAEFKEKWSRYGRIAAKLAFVYLAIVATTILSIRTYKSQHLIVNTKPVEQGVYDVREFKGNSPEWKDMVLYGVSGSIKTTDTLFTQRYERGYFYFEVDSIARQLKMKRHYEDTSYIMTLHYQIPDTKTLILQNDSVAVTLLRREKPFRLSENQFHWLQEWPQ